MTSKSSAVAASRFILMGVISLLILVTIVQHGTRNSELIKEQLQENILQSRVVDMDVNDDSVELQQEEFDEILYRPKRRQLDQYSVLPTTYITQAKKELVNIQKPFDTIASKMTKYSKNSSNGLFIIFVHSSLRNVHLRKAIRETWGSKSELEKHQVSLKFIVGKPVQESPVYDTQHESDLNRDIIFVDIVESYTNLTLKSLSMLHWCSTFCEDAKYLVKVDDDVFLNIPNLKLTLSQFYSNEKTAATTLIGHKIVNGRPIRVRHSKYYMPRGIYKKQVYPPYLSGSAYVIPVKVIPELLYKSVKKGAFWLEDVYITGILVKMCHLAIAHFDGFNMSRHSVINLTTEICKPNFISMHEVTDAEMFELWEKITNKCFKK